uniref:Transmembrane protein n=1 Tax=Panagrellus redivivus TaxID=6233 RepID=A0A7E4V121_PANRE
MDPRILLTLFVVVVCTTCQEAETDEYVEVWNATHASLVYGLRDLAFGNNIARINFNGEGTSKPILLKVPLDGTTFTVNIPSIPTDFVNLGQLKLELACRKTSSDVTLSFVVRDGTVWVVTDMDVILGRLDTLSKTVDFILASDGTLSVPSDDFEFIDFFSLKNCFVFDAGHVIVKLTIEWSNWVAPSNILLAQDLLIQPKKTAPIRKYTVPVSMLFEYIQFNIIFFFIMMGMSLVVGFTIFNVKKMWYQTQDKSKDVKAH